MRTSLAIPAMVAAATIVLVHGCTLPLAGVSSNGTGGAATTTTTTSSAGGTTTAAGVTASSTSTGVAECTTKMDCPPDGSCSAYDCPAGTCVKTAINEGMPMSDPSGNCLKAVCVGGELVLQNDDGDVADDNDPCTVDACGNGSPTHAAGNDGSTCGPPGQHCFGGKCLDCADATQCPQSVNSCTLAVCDAGKCGFALQPDGTTCAPGNECADPGTCASGACFQTPTNNGNGCGFGFGKCAGGGCCSKLLAICEGGTKCCVALQHCDGNDHCSF